MRKGKYKIIFTFLFLGFLFIHFYLPRFIVEIHNPISNVIRSNKAGLQVNSKNNITFQSFDGLKLSAKFWKTNKDSSRGTIILLHGIGSNKEYMNPVKDSLLLKGYNVSTLDLRAHGQSQGQFCTYGVKEKKDVKRLIDYLQKENLVNDEIGIYGQSLGGAIALQTMAYDARIKFGIIESTFSEFETIVHDYAKHKIGFDIPFFTNYLIWRAGKIADFVPSDASPYQSCAKITQPILMIHGNVDAHINIKYCEKNFGNIKSIIKHKYIIKGGTHTNIWAKGGLSYWNKTNCFLEVKY